MKANNVKIRNEKLRRHLQPILKEWTKIIDRYTQEYDEQDALYWYNERATLSTLVTAIARQDPSAHILEEYRTDKVVDDRRIKIPGRADLFFIMNKTEYVAEAKQIWVSISSRAGSNTDRITKSLRQARKESLAATDIVRRRLGIVFIIPKLPLSEFDKKEDRLREFIRELEAVDFGAMAYTFPEGADVHGSVYSYPGVACCIRVPRRA